MTKLSNKKGFKSLVSLLLVAAILITGALAYLTATDTAKNTFTVGNVKIDLTEPNWVESNGINITPGKTVAKDPTIENTGLNDAYVYVMVTVPKKDAIDVNVNGTATETNDYAGITIDGGGNDNTIIASVTIVKTKIAIDDVCDIRTESDQTSSD